ncbi:MAG: PepSY-like domain-containing protein [Chitinophagales bacterium]|nr:PepSY-like domain-containing protein [Chitinophagaceae bacterium]MCZ2297955.1 PepSY-like domain-containing protein [Chitinophagales bacterium]
MKKLGLSKSLMLILFLSISFLGFGQDRIIPYSEVPAKIQGYIKNHFPSYKVIQSKVDYEGLTKEYEITLNDSIKLEFDDKNNIKSIEAKSKLPESVIPLSIREYLKNNYPNNFIIEWELKRSYQSIELDNKVELEFTLKGNFIRIDN